MASSSLSQESLDIDDYDIATRRSRTRPLRSRVCVHKNESIETDEKDIEGELDSFDDSKENADSFSMCSSVGPIMAIGEHDSPTRLASRAKEKRGRMNHVHKGKTAKDKRKLREKRRSTGVVHLASTEVFIYHRLYLYYVDTRLFIMVTTERQTSVEAISSSSILFMSVDDSYL